MHKHFARKRSFEIRNQREVIMQPNLMNGLLVGNYISNRALCQQHSPMSSMRIHMAEEFFFRANLWSPFRRSNNVASLESIAFQAYSKQPITILLVFHKNGSHHFPDRQNSFRPFISANPRFSLSVCFRCAMGVSQKFSRPIRPPGCIPTSIGIPFVLRKIHCSAI